VGRTQKRDRDQIVICADRVSLAWFFGNGRVDGWMGGRERQELKRVVHWVISGVMILETMK